MDVSTAAAVITANIYFAQALGQQPGSKGQWALTAMGWIWGVLLFTSRSAT